jgi:hypothetical protein
LFLTLVLNFKNILLSNFLMQTRYRKSFPSYNLHTTALFWRRQSPVPAVICTSMQYTKD